MPSLRATFLKECSGQELNWREGFTKNWSAWHAEPVLQDGGVEAAEVGGKFQVTLAIKIGEAGVGAEQAGFDSSAGEEQWGSGAVVGALAGVLVQPPAELAESHQHRPLPVALLVQVAHERADRSTQFGQ